MGALWNKIPVTARTFVVGAIAIAGIFPLAGFFSKDEILWKTWSGHGSLSKVLWILGFITAGMTAFYMFRLVYMTFGGKSRVPHEVEHHIHESPKSMTVPLMILAALSVIGGWIGWPAALGGSNPFEHFLEPVMAPVTEATAATAEMAAAAEAHHDPMEYALMLLSLAMAGAGIFLAYKIYQKQPEIAERTAANWPRLHRLLYRKYYMDEIYDGLFVNRTKDLGTVLGAFDRGIIDGVGVNGTAWFTRATSVISIWWDTWIVDGTVRLTGALAQAFSIPVRMFQAGLVQFYALTIVIGVLVLLGYALYGR